MRPFFSTAWEASQRIYDPADTAIKVGKIIGGFVERNINNPDPMQRWKNTCAVRMSYILNESGFLIPVIAGHTVSGADKRQYFFRVRNLISFLNERWGPPEVVQYPPAGTFADRKGVILFEVSGWSDAQGHATLFDGRMCYDECYFSSPESAYRTDRAHFWNLP
jgi:hypothetical protein